ncbi:hypothetical protein [Longimicrobium sp.]|uniref:hypothetical protein n=1 Tax=Longimicrobium sp. TaxID=2029185 RepID=UPI002E3634A0|nr:hypothetical protein [Longimicrobium sp.]HEX6042297.1 hypothetical protein [Longimicrobium sp.]
MPRPEPTARATASASTAADTEGTLRLSVLNLALLGAGLAAIVGGFMLLGGGSITASTLLLVLGFAVLVPLGIIL